MIQTFGLQIESDSRCITEQKLPSLLISRSVTSFHKVINIIKTNTETLPAMLNQLWWDVDGEVKWRVVMKHFFEQLSFILTYNNNNKWKRETLSHKCYGTIHELCWKTSRSSSCSSQMKVEGESIISLFPHGVDISAFELCSCLKAPLDFWFPVWWFSHFITLWGT